MIVFDVDHFVIQAFFETQTKLLDAFGNDSGAANEGGTGQAFVRHNLGRTQDALFFTFAVGHTLFQTAFGRCVDGLHGGARGIHKALQALAIRFHVGNRARGHTTVSGSLCHGRRNFDHQAGIKWFGNEVLRTKYQRLTRISSSDHFTLLGLRQFSNGINRRNFHLLGDGGGATVQCAPENIREAQNIVHLIGVISASCGHDGVIANRFDVFRQNFWIGIGQCKDQGLGRHFLDHVLFQNTAS